MITIKDVAEKAGVSIGTVDRVVHKRGRVAPKTAERVNQVIRQFDYKPNIFASRLSKSKTYRFGVFMPLLSQDSRYWESVARGIGRAENELKPYHVQITYFCFDRFSESSFEKAGAKILKSRLDGILLAPVLTRPVQDFLKAKNLAPYVFFDASIPETGHLAFIGQDFFQSGVVGARLMDMLVPAGNGVAVLLAVSGDFHIDSRAEGFQSYYRGKNVDVRQYTLEGAQNQDAFNSLMAAILSAQPALGGVFVTNAATHFAACAIQSAGLNRKIALIGYDLIEENVDFLKKGVIDFLISQKAETQGYMGIQTLYRQLVLKHPGEKNVWMPIDIINKENLVYYNGY
jgi:LacI family transcriptional regulator